MENMAQVTDSEFSAKVHRFGRFSTIVFIISLLCVPLGITLIWSVEVDFLTTLKALITPLAMFLVVGTVEVFTIAPVLGSAGTYISFNTGNTLNLKMPAAVSSLKVTDSEPGTRRADIVGMIAIATSAIVTMIITFLGMVGISVILPVLESDLLSPAFENYMPALLGALVAPMLVKDFRTAVVPCAAAALLTLVLGYSTVEGIEPLVMPAFLALAVWWKYRQYRKSGQKKAHKETSEKPESPEKIGEAD